MSEKSNASVKFSRRGVFVIYDKVSEAWIGQPIIEKHPAAASRLFCQLLADKNSMLHAHPRDYALLHCGFIDDDGTVSPSSREVVISGEAWLSMVADPQASLSLQ